MLKLADLAVRPDICIGPLTISPARRFVKGPEGEIHLEPRVMQVFLLLIDSADRVVTRNEIFDQCWGGAMVGDDNINRAIAAIRRIAVDVAPGAFEVETIPRTGYRLVRVPEVAAEPETEAGTQGGKRPPLSRRKLVLGGAAAAVAAGAGGILWTALRPRKDPRFDALMERGEQAIRLDDPQTAKYFEQAVAIEPRNAKAWGLLAYVLGSGGFEGPSGVSGPKAQAAERAARIALEIDPNEPNALLAKTNIQSDMLDRIEREERYRHILALDPDNTLVMQDLGLLMSSVGRCHEALALTQRATAREPLAPNFQRRKAMSLWIVGRVPEADRVSDRAMQLWPSYRLVRMVRLMIYAFTGRERAALAMVEEEEARPIFLSPSAAAVWRVSLAALEHRSPSSIASARKANLDGAKKTPATSAYAIPILSALGELDAAFEVANGFLLGRGSVIVRPWPETRVPVVNGPGWRNTFGLFIPPTKAMRLDPRFRPLADGLGLTDYWRKRGIGPDAFLFKA
jgi:DNA-binding winged helix-turn-helix (wHTH) protein/Flp pilus assembly protein TadD